jgi:CBS domain-containing protein
MTDTKAQLGALESSYLTPSFEHARVRDALHLGVITCLPDTPMDTVARIMATNHVHVVVVSGLGGLEPWGVVTDRDVMAVAADARDRLAGSCASGELVKVGPDDRLADAVKLMREHGVSHLMVVDSARGVPVGVLSTLDVAGVVAWGRG